MRGNMRKLALALLVSAAITSPALAKHRHASHHHHVAHHGGMYVCSGCVVRETKAGSVAVSATNGDKLVAAINALYDAGFRGHVNCAAPYGTHVRHSLHHTGNACDMAQLHRNIVASGARIMYHARSILASLGVNDGCSFRDCGHISVGVQESGVHHRHYARRHEVRYARLHRHRHYASGV